MIVVVVFFLFFSLFCQFLLGFFFFLLFCIWTRFCDGLHWKGYQDKRCVPGERLSPAFL